MRSIRPNNMENICIGVKGEDKIRFEASFASLEHGQNIGVNINNQYPNQ